MISSVPPEHRGVATGTLYTMFGLGNVFGVTVGNFLMTVAFRMHSGRPDALPAATDQAHFVLALRTPLWSQRASRWRRWRARCSGEADLQQPLRQVDEGAHLVGHGGRRGLHTWAGVIWSILVTPRRPMAMMISFSRSCNARTRPS